MSSCLRRRFAPSTSFLTAMSTSSPTWRFFRSDRCMDCSRNTGGTRERRREEQRPRLNCSNLYLWRSGPGVQALAGRLAKSDMAVNKRGQLRFRERPHLRRLDRAVLEDHECRDAADAVFGRRRLVLVDIELGDFEAARIFLGDFIEDRRDHLRSEERRVGKE